MALFLPLAKTDLEGLVQIVIAAVFVLGPILKGILSAKKRESERTSRRAPLAPSDSDREDEGRTAWDALLRGEEPPARPAHREAPEPPAPKPRPRIATLEQGRMPRSLEDVLAPPDVLTSAGSEEGREVLTDSEPLTSAPPLTATRPLTESEALTESRPLTDSPALTDTPAFEGVSLARLVRAQSGANLRPSLDSVLTATEAPAPPARPAASRRYWSRDDWRRAVIAAEVLAPPVSMRSGHLSNSYADAR